MLPWGQNVTFPKFAVFFPGKAAVNPAAPHVFAQYKPVMDGPYGAGVKPIRPNTLLLLQMALKISGRGM